MSLLLKKFLVALAAAFIYLGSGNVTLAAPQEISAEGEYRLGDRDSREIAKIAALDDAKRKIIEQAGVYVESYSEINKFNVTTDQIKTAANALIKITHEEVHYYENGTLCRAFVVASIDTDNIAQALNDIRKPEILPSKPPSNVSKILEIAGFMEYNGHYYKVFNDSMSWYDADTRCKKIGGYLVTVADKLEQAFVQSVIFLRGTKNFYWTGGSRLSDNWQWNTHEAFNYSNWANGEPDNEFGNEYILVMFKSGKWGDCPAEGINHIPDLNLFRLSNSGFICEWDSYENINDYD